jgi:uncharacterized protein DUF2750
MIWDVNDEGFKSVLALPADRRYVYFVKRVADWEHIWSLAATDGWVLASDDQGRELVPVWPHPRFAIACETREWAGSEPRSIELADWMQKWIPGMLRDGRLVAVFPTPSDTGVVVSPDRLQRDLEEELSLIE